MRPPLTAAAAVVAICLVGLVSLPANSEASFSTRPDEALGSGSSPPPSLSPPEAPAGTETEILLQETDPAAEQLLSQVSLEAEDEQTALTETTETETALLQQPAAFAAPLAGQANPRRLMAAAGAGLGLLLLAGGALAHEHADSIKTGFKNIYHAIKNKPFSWSLFSWKLPRVDEEDFPEFRVAAEGLRGTTAKPMNPLAAAVPSATDQPKKRRTFVNVVEAPSPELATFLGLGDRERKQGFVLKGRSFREEFGKEQTAWEVYVMQRHVPKHVLFLPLLNAFRSAHTGNVYLVLPRACCDLSQYVHTAPRAMNFQIAAAEMTMALSLLHKRGFLHRDIKPHNYLVSQEGHVLLGDMEMLWPIDLPCPQEEATHTRGFAAPELQRIGSYAPFSIKTDVFALGMAFARMLMRMQRHLTVPRQNVLVKLILLMVEKEAKDRIDLDAVMRHAYFEGVDWQQVERGEAPPPCPLAKQVMNHIASTRNQQDVREQQQKGQKQQQQQHQQQEQQQGHPADQVDTVSPLQQQLAAEEQHIPHDHQQQQRQEKQLQQEGGKGAVLLSGLEEAEKAEDAEERRDATEETRAQD